MLAIFECDSLSQFLYSAYTVPREMWQNVWDKTVGYIRAGWATAAVGTDPTAPPSCSSLARYSCWQDRVRRPALRRLIWHRTVPPRGHTH